MTDTKLKLAVIGCGAIFENNHLSALNNVLGWEIAFLIDNDTTRLQRFATKLNCGYSNSVNDIPKTVDACLIATPNFLHAPQSIEMLNKGFHVICEKPMALSLIEAEQISAAAQKNKRHFFIVHQKRFQQNIKHFKKEYLPNLSVRSVDISLGNKFGWVSRTNFYFSPEKAGGGAFIDLGVHLFDLLLAIWQEIDVLEVVSAAMDENKPVIDTATTCLGYINKNIPYTLRVSRTAQLNNTLTICTDDQEFAISLDSSNILSVTSTTGDKRNDFQLNNNEESFEEYWKNIALVINGEATNIMPSMINDGLAVMRCIEMYRDLVKVVKI